MAAGNNILINLNLNDTQFKNGIKNAGQQLQSLVGAEKFVKLKFDAKDFRTQYQAELKNALSGMKSASAMSYRASNGKIMNVTGIDSAIKAYKRYIELANSASTTKEQNAYLRKANAVGTYIQTLSNLGNKIKETEMLENRLNRARNTGMVNAARQRAYRDELGKQGTLLGRLKTLAGSYLSVFTAFRYIKSLVDVTGFFEQQQVALEGILGSASAATKAIGQLKQMALQSPKQFKDLVGDAKQLSAYGIEAQNLLPTVKQLADISVGLGVDMSRLVLAYGQVKSASVLRGQELRQFTEAGVPMVEKLAEKFTDLNGRLVTTGEVFDLISKRQVSFEMVAEVLRDMTAEGGKFYNMQENISETLYGQVQKIKDLWTINLADTGSGISGVLMAGVKAIQLMIKESRTLLWMFGAAGIMVGVRALVNNFGAIKIRIGEIRAATVKWWGELRAAQGFAAKTAFAFKSIGKALISNVGIAALSVMVGLIARAAIKAREFGKELEKIDTSFAKDNAKYVQGFDNLIGKLSTLTEGTKKYNEALDTLKSNYSDYVNPAIIDQLIAERKQLDDTAEGWGRLHDSIVAAINARNDYERHKARQEKAGDTVKENADSLSKIFGSITSVFNTGYGAENNEVVQGLRMQKANEAYNFALESFLSANETDEKKLKQRLQQSFIQYGLPNEVTKFLIDNFSTIWNNVEKTKGWQTYLDEHKALNNTDNAKIDKAFQDAQERTSKRQEGRWREGMSNEEYNPTKLIQAGQFDLSVALCGLVIDTSKRVNEMLNNGTSKEDMFAGGAEGISAYNAAIQELNGEIKKMSVSDFQDAEKVNRIAQALHNLMATIKDPNLLQYLSAIQGKFNEMAGVKTGRAAQVSTNITRDFLNSGVYDHKTKDWYARYVKMTNDETFDSVRESIRKQYQENEEKIKSYGATAVGANKAEVDRLKAENERLKILAGEQYYDIDLTKKTGGSTSVTINSELSEFINRFKDAYARYKEATQQGGVEMGLGYVRNDEQFKNMFGDFFGGAAGEQFQKLYDIKLGNKSSKSVGEVLQDKFITSGLENGVMDFESAALDMAKELKEYYNGDTKHRKSFLEASKALEKWVYDVISKDNLKKAMDELAKKLNMLSLDFDKTTKAAELYRKLVANGTQGTLGNTIPKSLAAQAQTPMSELQLQNIRDMFGLYNNQLNEISEGKGAPFEFNVENGDVQGLYAVVEQLREQRSMNKDNFGATVLGQTGEKLEQAILQLIDTITTERANISGEQYTGNAYRDLLANVAMRTNARMYDLTTQENKARANGVYDNKLVADMVKNIKTDASNIFDSFINDSRLDVVAKNNFGKIDFATVKENFEKSIKDMPEELQQELLSKVQDLEIKINDMNAANGALSAFGNAAKAYRTAGTAAKGEFDKETAYNADLRGQLLEAQFNGDAAAVDELNVKLAESEERLKEMGKDGENLKVKLKDASVKAMVESLQTAQSSLYTMSNAVTSVVSAFKDLSNSVNKVYDIMNDGENPDWMQDMDGFLADFADDFEALIAPIGAVIAMVIALTVAFTALDTSMAIVMAVMVALLAVFAGIMAIFQQHDRVLERSIDRMKEQIDDFDNAITNLNAAAERQVGLERLQTRIDAVGMSLSKASEYANMAAAEDAKKNTDEDKLNEYKQQQQQFMDEFVNSLKSMADEITASTDDWASNMGNAIRSAFQNGENAARAFRNTVKDMIGDVVENMLEMAILQPMIEEAMESWTNQNALRQKYSYTDENGVQHLDSENYKKELLKNIGDPAKAEDFYKQMLTIGNTLIDVENGLPEFLQDALWNNSDLQSLSGGIESITEDTARRLEALGNSQLGALLNIQSILQNYVGGNGMYGSSPMADIQTSMAVIQSDTTGIRVATQTLLSELKALRSSSVQPLHVTLV